MSQRELTRRSIIWLEVLFLGMSMAMIALVIGTSMQQNLLEVSLAQPWFKTTLVDFYFNIIIISVWVVYKEANAFRSFLWIVSFVLLGSIATAFYVFLQLAGLKGPQGLKEVLLRKDA